jgi:twitching motility protein PilT
VSTAPPAGRRIDRFLRLLNDRGASDVHLTVGRPPMLRIAGSMGKVRYRILREADFESLVRPIAPEDRWRDFLASGDADFAYEVPGLARFRVNIFRQQRGSGAVLRLIPSQVMTLEELGLPNVVRRLAELSGGLVLVTGPTGSGKSTTLAAIVDLINATRAAHIITLEDPIEFLHTPKRCLVHQREIGAHAVSFADGIRGAMREDPDVVLVGEMRDRETISMALTAAEKGISVLGTLHTSSAVKTVDRIVSVFPAAEQDGVRSVLAEVLRAVVAQQLLPKIGGGRVAALELLFSSPAIGTMIREGKSHQIASALQTGSRQGMVEMDGSILALYTEGLVTARTAYDAAIDKDRVRGQLGLAEGE